MKLPGGGYFGKGWLCLFAASFIKFYSTCSLTNISEFHNKQDRTSCPLRLTSYESYKLHVQYFVSISMFIKECDIIITNNTLFGPKTTIYVDGCSNTTTQVTQKLSCLL